MRPLFLRFVAIGVFVVFGAAAGIAQNNNTDPRRQPQTPTPTAGTNVPVSPTGVNPPASGTAPAPESPGVAVDVHTYVIGNEDILRVNVWREPDLSAIVVVRPDGKITLPMIGEIQAGGLTPETLGKSLTEAFSKYVNNPQVLVFVQQVNSKKYYIDGSVNRPGEYRLIAPTTVLEALSEAGGFREFANLKKIRILRGTTTLKFNWKDVSHGKRMEQNIYLQNGDHIFVDE